MVIVKILSGPQQGQQNSLPLPPEVLLAPLAKEGWRWTVEWSTVPEDELFAWAREDLACKILSALVRGATIEFLEQSWQLSDVGDIERLAGEIEDKIVQSGYNVGVTSDEEARLIIGTHGTEHPVQ